MPDHKHDIEAAASVGSFGDGSGTAATGAWFAPRGYVGIGVFRWFRFQKSPEGVEDPLEP
jgi:hypothetical protein